MQELEVGKSYRRHIGSCYTSAPPPWVHVIGKVLDRGGNTLYVAQNDDGHTSLLSISTCDTYIVASECALTAHVLWLEAVRLGVRRDDDAEPEDAAHWRGVAFAARERAKGLTDLADRADAVSASYPQAAAA